jgi:hypothetical protein
MAGHFLSSVFSELKKMENCKMATATNVSITVFCILTPRKAPFYQTTWRHNVKSRGLYQLNPLEEVQSFKIK